MGSKSTFEEQTPHLSEPQRRSLEVTLCEMERLILHSRRVRQIAQDGDEDGVMLRCHASLDESQRAQLKAVEDATMEQLKLLRDALHLRPRLEDVQHQLSSAFSILWADLEDERPGRMVGYGQIEPLATSVLDSAIGKLIELCRDFVAVLEDETMNPKNPEDILSRPASHKWLNSTVLAILWPSPSPEFDYGFPSGHCMLTMALALALLVLLWRTRRRWPVLIIGGLLVLAVGFSRLYLGVHYPSDVLAAWSISMAWVFGLALHSGERKFTVFINRWEWCDVMEERE